MTKHRLAKCSIGSFRAANEDGMGSKGRQDLPSCDLENGSKDGEFGELGHGADCEGSVFWEREGREGEREREKEKKVLW